MTLQEVAKELLSRTNARYICRGYEQWNCNCCGALRVIHYEESHFTTQDEEHSKRCPWRLLQEALNLE